MTDGTAAAAGPPVAAPAPTAGLRREQIAVSTLFALLGFLFGTWVSRIPGVADRIGAGPGLLGAVLLAIAVGSMLSMPFAGRLCQRRSSTVVAVWFGIAAPISLAVVGLAADSGSPLLLAAALAVHGGLSGGLDVSMNANAVAAVRHARRPLMPAFHGLFSVGGMAGAGLGGLLASAGFGITAHFTLVAAAGVAATLLVAWQLAADPVEPRPPEGRQPERSWLGAVRDTVRRLDALLIVLGAVTFCAALSEGAMGDWTGLFLRDVLHTGDGLAATGFAVFSVTMAAGRFGGGAVLRRWPPDRVIAVGCLLAAAGTTVAVTAPVAAVAVLGFAAVGVGLSCAIPVAFNAAGAHRLGSGPAISLVSTVGYSGFLAGPPAIGALAQAAGLRVGLAAVAVVCTAGALLAIRWRDDLRRHDPSRDPAAPG